MENSKLETISNLFEGNEIRSIWDAEKEDYYFSVVDVIAALTGSIDSKDYWYRLKIRMTEEEKSELSTKCRQLKMKAKDGKLRETDTLDTKGILRLIESVPSPKAEPFKLWLAQLGSDRIDEVFDPEIAIKRAINYYRNRGYSDKWIEGRLKGILDRNKLTDVWKENGIKENFEYGILTNEIYKAWSGMKASEYKEYKNIRKESLRDDMTAEEIHRLTKQMTIDIYMEFGIIMTIGIYAANDNAEFVDIKKELANVVAEHKEINQVHGFYVDKVNKNVYFDLIIDFEAESHERIKDEIVNKLKDEFPEYNFIVILDADISD